MKRGPVSETPVRFWDAVAKFRERGISDLGRYRCRVVEHEAGFRTELLSNRFEPLPEESDDEELPRPEFWIPVGNNGEHRETAMVAPRWMNKREAAGFWREIHKARPVADGDAGDDETDPPICRDARTGLQGIANSKRTTARPEDDEARRSAKEGLGLLNRAIFTAHRLGGLMPQREESSTVCPAGEMQAMPALTPELAEMLHLAFRAGELSARASNRYNRNPETVRRGAKMAKGQKETRGPIKEWTKAAVEIMRANPGIKVRQLAEELQNRVIVEIHRGRRGMTDAEVEVLEDESRVGWRDFTGRVSRLRKGL